MAVADPTHKRQFNEETFGYFSTNGAHYRYHESYGIRCQFELLVQRVYHHRRFGEVEVLLRAHKTAERPVCAAAPVMDEKAVSLEWYPPLEPLYDQNQLKVLPWKEED